MPMNLSKRILSIAPSSTFGMEAKAKEMRKAGIDIVSFTVGEPDFDTPDYIKDSAIDALKKGFTKYTPASGIDELKEAISSKFKRDNNLVYDKSEVIVSCGAKHSLYNIFQAICNEGDEVIIPAPYWVSYPEQVKMSGGIPIFIDADESLSFKITPELLEKKITSKTKALVMNSPSNPTGMVYDKEELKALAEIILKYDFWVISDEVYEKLIYNGKIHYSIASFSEQIKARTLVVNAVSKTYSMTGWRLGYAAGPKAIVKAMANFQSQVTSNPTSFVQKAAITAINGPEETINKMKNEFDKRRKYIVDRVNKINGLRCIMPNGAFYAFVNILELNTPEIRKKIESEIAQTNKNFSTLFSEYLLAKANVAVVPGVDFGSDLHIRLSYATSLENIKKGIDRIEAVINKLLL